jgi:DnaJ-class molecular chaperone
LAQLGLPYDADKNTIKKRFRELAKKYHPDTGGDSMKFIQLMESYRKLVD